MHQTNASHTFVYLHANYGVQKVQFCNLCVTPRARLVDRWITPTRGHQIVFDNTQNDDFLKLIVFNCFVLVHLEKLEEPQHTHQLTNTKND